MTEKLDFWAVALRLYQSPGAEESCVALQDNNGVNVVMLLFCCWLGSQRRLLTVKDCQLALAEANVWSDKLVVPIRNARRWLKQQDGYPLYQQILAAEMAAEKHLMEQLEQLVLPGQSKSNQHLLPRECAQKNTDLYFQQAGISLDPSGQKSLDVIFSVL